MSEAVILTPEEYAKLMDDCVDDCIAASKTHHPLLAHDKALRERVNKMEDEHKSYAAADAHRMFWELKTEQALLVLKFISEMHCYRKKLGAPCHKALPTEQWCAVCVARNYMEKEGNPWGRTGGEAS